MASRPSAPYRPPSHNVGDSRRSPREPRDQSPGRYNDRNDRNDRDEYRGGSHTSERRRSIPDIRTNNNAFNSNRDNFREPMGREPTRDFPPRDTPRGPRNLIDAPTGPRASSYGSSEYRGDSRDVPYGHRDYRGDRGLSRGRGRGWRDDSRDRRDGPNFRRDDRHERGQSYRDDGRDRWGREPYNSSRRPTSPRGRGRSPTYVPREARDAPPGIEVDRARRGSRDGPLSGGSPSSDSAPFSRGYSRPPRGNRGRGRPYYDDRRSRSPDPSRTRRTQPSATPPPQVPAFGSNVSVPGPVPGVAVPTAPRYERVIRRGHGYAPSSVNLAIDNSKKEEPVTTPQSVQKSPSVVPPNDREITSEKDENETSEKSEQQIQASSPDKDPKAIAQSDRKRKAIIGKRQPKPIIRDVSDVEDSGDDLDDGYFEEEMAKVQKQIEQIRDDNPLMPREDPEAPFLTPFIEANVDEVPSSIKVLAPQPCIAPEVKQEQPQISEPLVSASILATEPSPTILGPRPTSKGKSRSATPLPSEPIAKPVSRNEAIISAMEPRPATAKRDNREGAVIPAWDPTMFLQGPSKALGKEPSSATPTATLKDTTNHSYNQTDTPMLDDKSLPPTLPMDLDGSMGGPGNLSRSRADVLVLNGRAIELDNVAIRERTTMEDSFAPTNEPLPRANANSSRRSSATPSHSKREGSSDAIGYRPIIAPRPRKPVVDNFSDDEDDQDVTVREEELEKVRPFMKTPPIDSLPNFNCVPFHEDKAFLAKMDALWTDDKINAIIIKNRKLEEDRAALEQADARVLYQRKQEEYLQYARFSNDDLAVKSREKFAKSKAKTALEAAAPQSTSIPSSGAKPEGQRRSTSRWATEHDFERVLRESEQEAKEKKEREDRAARAKTASAKEATIPAQIWSQAEWDKTAYTDNTGTVPFDRSFARLEFGEPIDPLTEEECKIFEEIYMEYPKQFSKIAEHLPGRDYKVCIQHYYAVKHTLNLKERLKKQPKKKKGRKASGKNPKSNALMADLGISIRDEVEEGQDADNGERRRPRRAAAPTWPIETPASENEVASPAPTPGRKSAAKGDTNGDAPPPKRKTKATREKGSKQTKNNQLLAAAPSTSATGQPESPVPPTVPSAEWRNRPKLYSPRSSRQLKSLVMFFPPTQRSFLSLHFPNKNVLTLLHLKDLSNNRIVGAFNKRRATGVSPSRTSSRCC
ncbi:uncharacterized protein LY89DRAFT_317025 [Mollisia scopiformis]|uniref:SANT domain-containing protein n=1 Tax=Mollisia scopiformis TaxID=149040 RepID=A0A132B9E4_MOLSC|nr:uncharacterized protein LY89DRAFT_317025 [Mollisia scopiformis]KUJ08991.1 hypothetical protein LY89DRAFT_317025 [Mollisia scopiformis]